MRSPWGVLVTINSKYSSDCGGSQLDSALTELAKNVKVKMAIEVAENRGRETKYLYNFPLDFPSFAVEISASLFMLSVGMPGHRE